jgi:hypothetical protein
MAEVNFIKTSTGLVPISEADKEIYNRWKLGRVICGKFSQSRNYEYHKRFFGLLNLAFDYYEPSSGVLTRDEKELLKKVFISLDNASSNSGVMLEWGREFIRVETDLRKSKIENIQKAFEPFREEMIIESGFYDEVRTPLGIKKYARSISFASMDDHQFRELYKAVFNTLWRFVLSRYFKNEDEAEDAAIKMLSYS